MEFWFIAVVITALVAAMLALAARARRAPRAEVGNDVQIYRDQLEEVARDQARGVLSETEAERLRIEVSRRILGADRDQKNTPALDASLPNPIMAAAIILALFAGTFVLYFQLGSPAQRDLPQVARLQQIDTLRLNRPEQSEIEARVGPREIPDNVDPALPDLMVKLRAALQSRPNDLQGHELLARNEAALGDFAAAHKAQRRILEIKGDDATAADYASYADLLVLAADGYVSPTAETAIARTLSLQPTNGAARYYLGLMQAQVGRPDLAFSLWRTLLDESIPSAPWVTPIRAQIEFVAAEAGARYTLPALTVGPSADQIAAARELSAEEQTILIRSMVDRLSSRLAEQGGSPQEWARLIGALGVLGEIRQAGAIWDEAQQVFASSPEALAMLREAAVDAGLIN